MNRWIQRLIVAAGLAANGCRSPTTKTLDDVLEVPALSAQSNREINATLATLIEYKGNFVPAVVAPYNWGDGKVGVAEVGEDQTLKITTDHYNPFGTLVGASEGEQEALKHVVDGKLPLKIRCIYGLNGGGFVVGGTYRDGRDHKERLGLFMVDNKLESFSPITPIGGFEDSKYVNSAMEIMGEHNGKLIMCMRGVYLEIDPKGRAITKEFGRGPDGYNSLPEVIKKTIRGGNPRATSALAVKLMDAYGIKDQSHLKLYDVKTLPNGEKVLLYGVFQGDGKWHTFMRSYKLGSNSRETLQKTLPEPDSRTHLDSQRDYASRQMAYLRQFNNPRPK